MVEEYVEFFCDYVIMVNASAMKMLTLKNDMRYRDNSNVSRVM